jgi:NADH dehydrogenase/NADH:ubiquinone oxidoreductase subunit G
MDFTKLLETLLPLIGQKAVDKIQKELTDLSAETDSAWQKAVLALTADAVAKFGPQGIVMAVEAITALKKNKVPKIDWADLRVASDVLAALQNAEADKKTKAQEFLVKLSNVLGLILSEILKAII